MTWLLFILCEQFTTQVVCTVYQDWFLSTKTSFSLLSTKISSRHSTAQQGIRFHQQHQGFHVYLFNWRLQVQCTSEVTHIRRHNSLKVPHWKGKQDVRARITSFFYRRVSNEMRAQDKVGGWLSQISTQPSLLTHQLQLPITSSTHSDCLSNQYFLLSRNKTKWEQ